jgi:divalent metal cation (Fe/Co/Zn/Cd) transporter
LSWGIGSFVNTGESMKEIIFKQFILDVENMSGIMTYRIKEQGKERKKLQSIKVDNFEFSKLHLKEITDKIKGKIKEIEKVTEVSK